MIHFRPALPREELLDVLPVAVYSCDKDGRITYYNEAAVKLWGYSPDIGDPLLRYCACQKVFIDGNYIPPEKTPMAVALKTGQVFKDTEAVVERADGTRFHALISINPLLDTDGEVSGAVSVFRDITEKVTERDAAVEALRKSEDRYHKMIDEVEDYAIILLDRQGIIQNWNKGAEKIKGYKEEEIVGKSFLEFYLPDDQESGLPLQFLQEAGEKGKALYEGWRKRKDGSVFWGSVVLTALHDDRDRIIGFSKVTRDLTTKKRAEDRLNEYLKQLEFQNAELEQFVYAASHDMKEPLRKIHLYNSYIAADPNNVLDDKSKEYFARNMQASQRMSTLIEDLLAYAKITTIDEEFQPVDLNRTVDEIVAFHSDDFQQKRISLQHTQLPVIRAIPFQIKQLLSNLIDNAVKYRHEERDSDIRITAERVSGENLPAPAMTHRQFQKITITDNGIGFDPAQAAKIFEIFKRLSGTGSVKGSGIGLAICKKIIQNHNGIIQASGTPDKGASFSIFFPTD